MMLVLIAVIALAGGAALHDVWFAQQLANTRAYEHRAMSLAELGLRMGMEQLARAPAPPPDSGELRPGPAPADSLRVTLRPGAAHLAAGFSAGRFASREYEIESTGLSVRGARRVLVQGAARLEPAAGLP